MNHKSPERAKLNEEIILPLQAIPAILLLQKQVNQNIISRKTAVKKNYVVYVVKKEKTSLRFCETIAPFAMKKQKRKKVGLKNFL